MVTKASTKGVFGRVVKKWMTKPMENPYPVDKQFANEYVLSAKKGLISPRPLFK